MRCDDERACATELPASCWLACRCLGWDGLDLRLLSWRERCSDLLNARLQNWHLYRFSFSFSLSGGAVALEALRLATGDAPGVISAPATADMLRTALLLRWLRMGLRAIS